MSDIVRTCQVVDELVTDDGAVVLLEAGAGHRVVRLSVLGQLIRELAVDGIPMDRLAAELEARLGPAGDLDALQLTAESVEAMEADGLVSMTPDEHANTRNKIGDKL
jgi:hypothetical protein